MKPQPKETVEIETATVGCDGGGGALGHPLVYLTVTQDGTVDCPYCGRHYVLRAAAAAASH